MFVYLSFKIVFMAQMLYFSKPYELQQLIDEIGQSQTTLANALIAVNSDVSAKLPYACPNCVGVGRINAGANECPTCYGWGATETQIGVVRSFSPVASVPSEPTL